MNILLLGLLLISVIVNLLLVIHVLRPLRQLSTKAAHLAEGDFAALDQSCGGIAEIDTLRRSMLGMAGHLQREQSQSSAYAGALTRGQESERQRLAHELHDDTVQALITIGQSIDLARNFQERDPARAEQLLTVARQQSTEAVNSLRNLIADLRPPALEELGLTAALETLAERSPDVKVSVTALGRKRRLDEALELVLFRSAQEALSNAKRHGKAAEVQIQVAYQPDGMRLTVRDNGQGIMNPHPPSLSLKAKGDELSRETLDQLAADGHYGLLGIQERLSQLNGTLNLTSTPNSGTTLEVYIPFDTNDQPSNTVRDPVCSAFIQPEQAYGSVVYKGETYYFCCPVCRGAFQRDPEAYLVISN